MSLWATTYMTDEESEGFDGRDSEYEALQDHIVHWMEVLDRWVKRIDSGLGRQEGGEASLEGDGTSDSAP